MNVVPLFNYYELASEEVAAVCAMLVYYQLVFPDLRSLLSSVLSPASGARLFDSVHFASLRSNDFLK